nr:cytochrome c heme attachment protein [Pellia epiphylla]WIA68296.1 cytochrome c heme attachment protein [Pellia epiphylla]WIA68382.1 cytochrome c heme attachment protein [Pellia epiphylla]
MTIFTISEQILARASSPLLLPATLIYWGKSVYTNNQTLNIFGKMSMIPAYSCMTGFPSTRRILPKHFPLSNLYESSMFLSWSLMLIHLILESKNSWLGIVTAPSAVSAHGFATLCLPKEMQESIHLVPAPQSHWLMMHVTTMIFSYATLSCGSLSAMALPIITATKQDNFPTIKFRTNSFLGSWILGDYAKTVRNDKHSHELREISSSTNFRKWRLIKELDDWSYRIIGFGFPLLTIGILSGAVWANEAWGSYWNWDPKETWALITWLIFAIYLHTRMIRGWWGHEPAIIASSGFFIIRIRYSGVNLLGKGLHSYGWLLRINYI